MNSVELLSTDLVRLTFIIGMIFSVFLYEKSHLTTGSIVVPGFLGVHILEPLAILVCMVNSLICFGLVHRVAPKLFFMSNPSKFHALVITSMLLQLFWHLISNLNTPVATAGKFLTGLGCVIPGLIAHDMSRNGAAKTATQTILATVLTGAFVLVLLVLIPRMILKQSVRDLPPNFDLVILLTISTLTSVFVKTRTDLRCGYVAPAYIVLFSTSFKILILIGLASIATYLLVVHLLMKSMIIFGRRKFALMLIVGALVQWLAIILMQTLGISDPLHQHSSISGIVLLLPGLIANEMQRSSGWHVLAGLSIVSICTYSICNLCYEVLASFRPQQVIPSAVLIVLFFLLIIFFKQNDRVAAPFKGQAA